MEQNIDKLLKNNLDNVSTQKNLFGEEIKQLSMRDRIGFLPLSIWKPDWTIVKRLKGLVGDTGQTRELKNNNVAGLPGFNNSASIFNPHLAQMILSAYCPSKAKIYDAFGGGGTRGFIATAMGHDYTGVELRQDEVDRIKQRQVELNSYFNIVCCDSTKYEIEPYAYDFSYTCPPYYNLEVYSDSEEDLSNAGTYEDFLNMLEESLNINYRGMKDNSLSVWVVGNFRDKKGNLTHFNGDLARLGKKVGFKLHDEIIFWGASGNASQRCGQFEANRKIVRVHESLIIFKK